MISKKRLLHLTRSQRGITSVEFALIAPVFLLIVMGVIEFSMAMFTSVVLESATNNTARLGKTGYVPTGKTRSEAIIDNVKTRTTGLLDPNKISISEKTYSNFDKIGQPEPCIKPITAPCPGVAGVNFVDINGNNTWDADMGQAGLGNPGDVVVYTVSYPWKIMTPIVGKVLGNTITLTARAVVRNEPYSVSR